MSHWRKEIDMESAGPEEGMAPTFGDTGERLW